MRGKSNATTTTTTEMRTAKTKTAMRKYQRKNDVISRPFRNNMAFPRVFQSKTEKTEKKKEAEEEAEDDDEDGDEHSEDEDDDAKIPGENDVISRPCGSNIILSVCFPKQDGADGEEERTLGGGGG